MSLHFGQREADPDGVWETFSWSAKTGGDVNLPLRIRELSPTLFEQLRKPYLKTKRRGVRVTEEIPRAKQKAADRALLDYCVADWDAGITGDFCVKTGLMYVGPKDVKEYSLPSSLVTTSRPAETEVRPIPCDSGFIKYFVIDKLGQKLEAGDNPTSDLIDFAQELSASIEVIADDDEVEAALGNSETSPSSSSEIRSSTAGDDPSETSEEPATEKALA